MNQLNWLLALSGWLLMGLSILRQNEKSCQIKDKLAVPELP
jgi:hypothetical protein